MKLRYKMMLIIVTFALVGCLYITQSYAIWQANASQTNANNMTAGCFSISFSGKNNISLTNAFPISDTLALQQETPYTFTVTNTCTVDANYKITLNTLNTNTLTDDKIKYVITEGTATAGSVLSTNNTRPTTTELNDLKASITNLQTSYVLTTGTLAAGTRGSGTSITSGGTKTYKLYLWINETAGKEVMKKTFNAKIAVTATNPDTVYKK